MTLPVSGRSEPESGRSAPANERAGGGAGAAAILGSAVWCGLVAGIAEVGITVLRKTYFDADRFYGMSRHFLWLVPVVDLVIFAIIGLILSGMVGSRVLARRVAMRWLAAFALVPVVWTAFPRVYGLAGLILAVGAGLRIFPWIEVRRDSFGRLMRASFPIAVFIVAALALGSWAPEQLRRRNEEAQPLPGASSPSVLLVVLDTVAASHLSLHGYDRATSRSVDELAARGIWFRRARATSSWTLPSHASMFTGRWPHELSTGWLTPLDDAFPTVAEYLSSNGYSTAGFAANLSYCASDSGLARGFATYRDFHFPALSAFYTAVMVRRIVDGLQQVHAALSGALGLPVFSVPADLCWQLFAQNRKAAAVVNAEFLAWIRDREQPDRPFFAFLNYYDAHHPYQPAPAGIHRFGRGPASDRELAVIRDWAELVKQAPSEADVAFARDSYDDCVADLDERLGQLIDELETRGVLKNTWVIVTADHGESFGEHPGVFLHGATLYQTETHVPLLVIPPPRMAQTAQVAGPVSLRDLAATIVAIAGLEAGSPFPGTPLLKVSAPQALMTVDPRSKPSPALAELAHEIPPYSSSTAYDPLRWPLSSLVTEDWSYFRRDGNLRELLFDVTEDPKELKNRASDSEVDSTLSQMRATLLELTSGPLTPARFHP